MVSVVAAHFSFFLVMVNLIPTTPLVEEKLLQDADGAVHMTRGKSRKRVLPVPQTQKSNPLSEAYGYCNTPSHTEQAWEGHIPADYTLLSVQVMIRHGDRYPLYAIPRTKRPAINCTLSISRNPSHPLLRAFISHMALGGQGHWESPLASIPRIPNHNTCEMGELTQTGVVQQLHNGKILRQAYRPHNLIPTDWSPQQVWVETTGKSRTLQSGLAFLYGFLPKFDWKKLTVHSQWSTLFCGSACDCPARNRYLEEDQRRQYRLRLADKELERTYADMATTLNIPTRKIRAANPIDSLLCHLCHNISFPCVFSKDRSTKRCLSTTQFAVIRRQQLDDEIDRTKVGFYRKFAILAMYPYLNRTANKMERVAKVAAGTWKPRAGGEEVFTLSSAHDVTMAPLLSALGLEKARFPPFAARLVFEMWESTSVKQGQLDQKAGKGERSKLKDGPFFIRLLYNQEDVTYQTAFCSSSFRSTSQPLCSLKKFLSFVRRDMFNVVNATSYREACYSHTV
ncbi:2-phosphoxylose phosphatase 1 isoform X2 [Stigmatopora nigra]